VGRVIPVEERLMDAVTGLSEAAPPTCSKPSKHWRTEA